MTWQYRNRWIRGPYDIAGKKVLVEDPGYHLLSNRLLVLSAVIIVSNPFF